MSAHFPEPETVRTALALATRAPSVHNVQPWAWRVGTESLHLYLDPTRRLEHTDPDGRDVMISCGAVLNPCVVALAALGWPRRVQAASGSCLYSSMTMAVPSCPPPSGFGICYLPKPSRCSR